MSEHEVSAEVISCPGRLGDVVYQALQVNVEGFSGPYVLTLALPRICCTALGDQFDPERLYEALAAAINTSGVTVKSRETAPVETAASPATA
jgi:hypothetical protein